MMTLNPDKMHSNNTTRRKFLKDISKAAGSAMILASPISSFGSDQPAEWTVGQIMDLFMDEVPGGPLTPTVDTLKSGNRDMKVTGIVTTMFPTFEVIRKSIDLKANFIICHEPTYYGHQDSIDWLENDELYKAKSELLKKNNITIWRNHDHIHRHFPDGVKSGVITKLGWENYWDPKSNQIVNIPEMTLKKLIDHVKQKLGIPTLRYSGYLSQPCRKILFNPGFNTGNIVIPVIAREKPDVVMGGEFHEWEAVEYIRDLQLSGQKTSLIIMGHSDSEEPGSAYMAEWLKEKVKGVNVTHMPAKNPLSFM